jgi:hypothetical protein
LKVRIGCEVREVSALEFIESCKCRGVEIKRDWYRPFCAHEQAQAILDASPDLEADVLIALAKDDIEVRDALKERITILWVEGLPHSAMDAARALTGR